MSYREKYFTYVLICLIPGALLATQFSGGPIAGFFLTLGLSMFAVVAGVNLAMAVIQDTTKK